MKEQATYRDLKKQIKERSEAQITLNNIKYLVVINAESEFVVYMELLYPDNELYKAKTLKECFNYMINKD